MSELKRPEEYVEFESIKPKFKDLVEFYTNKSQEYRKRILEFSEYADGLEKEISILKDKPKIEILLDNTGKQLVVVPKFVSGWLDNKGPYIIATSPIPKEVLEWSQVNTGFRDIGGNLSNLIEIKVIGYTVEKQKLYLLKHIEISNRDTTINCYLTHTFTAPFIGHTNFSKGYDMSEINRCHFTQSEIDDMETGSYEQIAVTFEEVEDD